MAQHATSDIRARLRSVEVALMRELDNTLERHRQDPVDGAASHYDAGRASALRHALTMLRGVIADSEEAA